MPRALLRTKKLAQAGFSPVEVLLAAALLGFLVTALVGGLVYGRQSTSDSGDRMRALMLVDEGLEAVRNIRDNNYSNLTNGTHGLVSSGGQWSFSGTSDTTGIYTRSVTISSVDTKRKLITATVSWNAQTGSKTATSMTRLTDWRAAITPSTSWSNASLASDLDPSGNDDGLKIAVSGNYAYMVRSGTGLVVFDITNPDAPSIVSTLSLTGSLTNIYISGSHAYISGTGDSEELQIVNISNPLSPSLTSTFNANSNNDGLGIFVSGNTAYLTRASGGGSGDEFISINVTNPASPTLLGSYNNNINMHEVTVVGSTAYVATNSNSQEVLVINLSVPALPVLATSINLAGNNDALTIWNYADKLLIGQGQVAYIYDLTIPLAPTAQGNINIGSTINDIVGVDNSSTYAFAATDDNSGEFKVIDVSNPLTLSLSDTVSTGNDIIGLAYSSTKDRVFGASEDNGQEFLVFRPN